MTGVLSTYGGRLIAGSLSGAASTRIGILLCLQGTVCLSGVGKSNVVTRYGAS